MDDTLTAICHARLCPQVRWQPNYGVLADNIFHREDSSLIGILTFGRCTVAMGAIGCLLSFTLSMLCLILSFHRTCKDDIVQEDCLLCCGKHVEISTPPAHPVFFRKHTFTQARQLGPEVCLFGLLLVAVQVRGR